MCIEITKNLIIYYPQYSNVDLACGQMPQKTDYDVLFCCKAEFTGDLLEEFKHSNIAGHHVSDGKFIGDISVDLIQDVLSFIRTNGSFCFTTMLMS